MGFSLCARVAAIRRRCLLHGNAPSFVRRSETDRQPVYDIQRAHGARAYAPATDTAVVYVSVPRNYRWISQRCYEESTAYDIESVYILAINLRLDIF